MKLMDDIEALQDYIKDDAKADRILSEQIKIVYHHMSYSFPGGFLTGVCLFFMMYTTIEMSVYQKVLNIVWITYHSLAIMLCWYCWHQIFTNSYNLNIKLIRRLFAILLLFLTVAGACGLVPFAMLWTKVPLLDFEVLLVLFWIGYHALLIYLCWQSWKKIERLALEMPSSENINGSYDSDSYPLLDGDPLQGASGQDNPVAVAPHSSQHYHRSRYIGNYTAYRLLLISALLVGCLWALVVCKVMITNIKHYTQIIVMLGLHFGLLAGAMASIGLFWRVYIALVVPSLLSWSLTLLYVNEPRLFILSIAILMLLLINIIFAKYTWLSISRGILIYLENTELVTQLQAKTQEVEEASLARTQFLASASHDLRQPIHALSLFIETLASTELTSHQLQIIDYAKSASQSSREMLNTILDYAHLESGEMKPHIVSTDLDSIIQNLIDEFGLQARKKRLTLRYTPTDACVLSDPAMLPLILRNFISNALRYTTEGGVLVGVRLLPQKKPILSLRYCRVSVWDTGSGMTEDETTKVFASFYQLDRNDNSNQGLGLGLSIAKGLAHLLNVPIDVKSKVGKGSRFSIDLPICQIDYPCHPSSRDIGDYLLGKTILVVDDEDAVLKSMRLLLEAWGCNVMTALDINQAIAVFESSQPDIVVTDFRLANSETGEDVILAIKDLKNSAGTRFVMLTGDTSPDLAKVSKRMRLVVLHKPIDPKTLQQKLQQVVVQMT